MADARPFGVLVSGQPVLVEFKRLCETDFIIEVPNANAINYIAVFLNGSVPFSDLYGASVYIRWSDNNSNNWHYLGAICNSKPSAFFRVANFMTVTANHDSVFSTQGQTGAKGSAQIGITVEPLSNIEGKMLPTVTNQATFKEFQEKTIKNLVNYAQSFARVGNFIPVETIDQWYQDFKQKLQINPNFWRSLSSD